MLHRFTDLYSEQAAFFDAVGTLLPHPLFVVDEQEQLLACNQAALTAVRADSIEQLLFLGDEKVSPLFVKAPDCYIPDGNGWMGPLGERTPMVALAGEESSTQPYRLHVQPVVLKGDTLYLIYLDDLGVIQRAKKAEHYFETFKQQFLTNISHEFRTPMNAIIGFAGLLERTNTDAQQSEYVTNIQKSAGTMLESIENLLDLMQVESGLQKPKREPFEVYKTLEAFMRTFIPQAEEKGIGIYFILDPRLPERMVADIELVKKVLRNLISNAIKFTAKGGQVLVEVEVVKPGGRMEIRYSVTDTGEGIDKSRLRTLLRPFASSQENQIHGKEGFGVGLSLAFKLLKLLGSELTVASEVGKGSRFSFNMRHPQVAPVPFEIVQASRIALWCEDEGDVVELKVLGKYLKRFGVSVQEVTDLSEEGLDGTDALFMISRSLDASQIDALKTRHPDLQLVPVIRKDLETEFFEAAMQFEDILIYPTLPTRLYATLEVLWKQVPKELLRPEAAEKKQQLPFSRRVLVAEDNPINQKLVRTILEQAGYKVTTADNGQLATDAYEQGIFDAVLMDIDMPVMDGISATQAIREIDRRDKRSFVPVIALTARALAGDRERIIAAGLDAHLAKPVDREFLLLTLEQYLRMKDERNRKVPATV